MVFPLQTLHRYFSGLIVCSPDKLFLSLSKTTKSDMINTAIQSLTKEITFVNQDP